MKRFLQLALPVLLVGLGTLVLAPAAHAGNDLICDDAQFGGTYDNVVAPRGAECSLFRVTVHGNAVCDDCSYLDLHDSVVYGNAQLKLAREGSFTNDNTIGGNLQIEDSRGGDFLFEVINNKVGGNLQFTKNRGVAEISDNQVEGNLQCFGNLPAPQGSGNTANAREGQCRDF